MDTSPLDPTQQPRKEAERYARLLDWGTRVGEWTLLLTFAAYLLGVLEPLVPLDQLPSVWNLPVKDYLQRTGTPTGWGWLALATKGDLANLIGIAVLAGCSLPPLLALIPLYLRHRNHVYAIICARVGSVLVMAASGLLTGGH